MAPKPQLCAPLDSPTSPPLDALKLSPHDAVSGIRKGHVSNLRRKVMNRQNLPELAAHGTWLAERGKSERTRTEYLRGLRQLAVWLEERDATLLTATSEHMKAWRSGLTVEPNTVLGYVTAVRSFYRWAIWASQVTADPSADLPLPKRRKGRPRPISEESLVIALVNAPAMIRPWLMLAALLGLRACEIAALRREDIIEYQETRVLFVRGKGGKERIVPLRGQAWRELLEAGLPSKGWLFLRHNGKGPRTPQNISFYANQYLHSIGISETLHQLRHRFGTKAYAVHQDIRVVQELMGHASPATTALYADYSRSAAIATTDAIEIDLSRPDGRKLPADPARSKVRRPPHRPVHPRVQQPIAPTVLGRRELPERGLELPEQQPARPEDHPVRKPPARATPGIAVMKGRETVVMYQGAHGLVQLVLCHAPPSARE